MENGWWRPFISINLQLMRFSKIDNLPFPFPCGAMSSTQLLDTVSIPTQGSEIGERIRLAQTRGNEDDQLFIQALFRHDLRLCAEGKGKTDPHTIGFIEQYFPPGSDPSTDELADAICQRTIRSVSK